MRPAWRSVLRLTALAAAQVPRRHLCAYAKGKRLPDKPSTKARKRLSAVLKKLPSSVRTAEGPHLLGDSDHSLRASDLPLSTRKLLVRLRKAGGALDCVH